MEKVFQIGKTYKHNGGRVLKIVGMAETMYHGSTLVAEDNEGNLSAVGRDETHFLNWKETQDSII